MKRLFGMSRKSLASVFLTTLAFVLFLCVQSCNQSPPPITNITNKVIIKVEKDANVESVTPASFEVDKGSELGSSDIKAKVTVKCKQGYEPSKICLNNATGKEITDGQKYKFDANTTIYMVSRQISSTPKLISLKLDGKEITPIQDAMNGGSTPKAKVLVEADQSPSDANVKFDPELDANKMWALNDGDNTLTIEVKKGNDTKTYTITLQKVDENTPILSSLTVAGQTIEGAQITSEKNLTFAVADFATEALVKAETTTEGASIDFDPPLSNNKLPLDGASHATKLKIIVKKGSAKTEYNVIAKKTVQTLLISGGKKLGVESTPSDEDLKKIQNHEKDVNITIAGGELLIIAGTKKMGWKSVKINGKPIQIFPYNIFKSVFATAIPLNAKGEVTDIKINIESAEVDGATGQFKDEDIVFEEISFKVTRQAGDEGKVDIPAIKLLINDENVTPKSKDIIPLYKDPRPEYNSGTPATVEVQFEKEIGSVTIDGKQSPVMSKQEGQNTIWYATNTVDLQNGGKDVDVVMNPKDDETETYSVTTWKFRLNYEKPSAVDVDYEINNLPKDKLPKSFVTALEKGEKGDLRVEGKALNLKLVTTAELEEIKINGNITISANEIEKLDADFFHQEPRYVAYKSIDLQASGKKEIRIVLSPKNKAKFSEKVLLFDAESDGTSEVIKPVFVQIGDDQNLPKESFLDKLAGNDEPVYHAYGSETNIVITLSEYENMFLCEQVKVNTTPVKLEKVEGFFKSTYKLSKTITVNASDETPITIEFEGKANVANTLTWKFKLKGDGTKPSIPKKDLSIFKINEFGSGGTPFDKSFSDHLTDDTKPLFKFYGKKAKVTIGAFREGLIKNAEFKLDATPKETVVARVTGYAEQVEYEYEVDNTEEHEVEIIVNPKDEAKYSPLKYSFKIQSLELKEAPKYLFAIDYQLKSSEYKATLNAENANLLVQSSEDVMGKVEIGEEGHLENCDITSFTTKEGKIWTAKKDVILDVSNEKVFVIKVTPKDTTKYAIVECKYHLKGTKVSDKNAEFALNPQGKPIVSGKITWKTGLESNTFVDDYGAEKVTITANTVSPRAKVMWQFINPITEEPIQGHEGELNSNNKGSHTGEVTLLTDKPTKVKAWVIAEDTQTTDADKGVWTFTYNPVPLLWSYNENAKPESFKTKAYDTIEIDKTQVKDGKIALLIIPWQEGDGYVVDNEALPEGQGAFVKQGKVGNLQEAYKSIIQVSKLLEDNPTVDHVAAIIKIKLKGIECINYPITIKLKS